MGGARTETVSRGAKLDVETQGGRVHKEAGVDVDVGWLAFQGGRKESRRSLSRKSSGPKPGRRKGDRGLGKGKGLRPPGTVHRLPSSCVLVTADGVQEERDCRAKKVGRRSHMRLSGGNLVKKEKNRNNPDEDKRARAEKKWGGESSEDTRRSTP